MCRVSRLPCQSFGRREIAGSEVKLKDVEAEVVQVHVELNSRNDRVTKLEARAMDLKNEPEQSESQMRVAESQYSLLYEEAQTPMQRLCMGVLCNGKEWRDH